MKSSVEIVVGYSLVPKGDAKKLTSDLSPYRNQMVDVHMIIPTAEKAITYRAAGRQEGSGKLKVCEAAATFIKKHSREIGLKPVFVGFDIRQFLRFVGLECALSHTFFPLDYWNDSSHTIDLYACLTAEKDSNISDAFRYFSDSFTGEDLEKYTALVKGWVPHKNAERDARLAFLFGSSFWLWGSP
jgi:hypothetical protein